MIEQPAPEKYHQELQPSVCATISGFSLHGMGLALSRGELKIPPLERGPPCCRAFGPRAQRSPSPDRDLRLVQTGGLNLPGLLSDPAANAAERDPDEEPELCLHTKTSCLARPGATSIASVRQAASATARIRLVLLRYPRQGAPRGVHRRKILDDVDIVAGPASSRTADDETV